MLKVIDISNSRVNLRNLDKVVSAIQENAQLESISLKGISVLQITDREIKDYEVEVAAGIAEDRARNGCRYNLILGIIKKLEEIITSHIVLQHVDISNMGLRDRMIPLVTAITKSVSLLSVHLGGNNLTNKAIEKMCFQLKLDHRQYQEQLQDIIKFNQTDDELRAINRLANKPDFNDFADLV